MPERRKAFTELFDAHFPAVLQFLQRRCRTAEDAEDIAADVFRVAWEKQDPRHPYVEHGRGLLRVPGLLDREHLSEQQPRDLHRRDPVAAGGQ